MCRPQGLKPLNRPVGYMVNGQMEPLLSMRAKEALVLDMVHVGGRHVLELEMQRDVMATSVGGVGAAVTQAVGAPCTMHLMANDGVDYEAGRKVRTFASSNGPYDSMCVYAHLPCRTSSLGCPYIHA